MQKIDLLIKNGFILQFNTNKDFFQKKSIIIDKGKIIEIGNIEDLSKKYDPKQIISAKNKIVMPGFVNTHTHLAMSYYKGLADDLPLMEWLQKHIWPVENKFIKKELVYNAALHGAAEMIKNGITTFNDMYFFGDETARACEKVGIRAVLGEGVLDFPVANYQNANEIFSYIKEMYEKYKDDELIDFAIAPHAIYTCGKENLIKAKELASKLDLLLHIHLSETEKEVHECLKKHKLRPVEYLDSLGLFKNKVLIAHGIWMNDKEMEILSQKNISVSINTKSNLKLANGFTPIKKYLKHEVNLSLGTDGVASNNNLSMFEEMGIVSTLHKTLNNDPTFLPAEQVVKMATINGAKSLNKEKEIGSIGIGKKADLILIETNDICVQPVYNPYSHLVYVITSEQVKDVIINGKIVMKDRNLINVDEEEMVERAKYYKSKILKFNHIKN